MAQNHHPATSVLTGGTKISIRRHVPIDQRADRSQSEFLGLSVLQVVLGRNLSFQHMFYSLSGEYIRGSLTVDLKECRCSRWWEACWLVCVSTFFASSNARWLLTDIRIATLVFKVAPVRKIGPLCKYIVLAAPSILKAYPDELIGTVACKSNFDRKRWKEEVQAASM
jgi:hypothetical protein